MKNWCFVSMKESRLIVWFNSYKIKRKYYKSNFSEIPKEKYKNIFKGAYERPEKYVSKNKTRKVKKNYL